MNSSIVLAAETARPLILVVDDEDAICSSLEGVLKDENFNTKRALSGEEALEIVKTYRPELVFLDMWMPGWDGIETLERIKQAVPKTQVVMISGHATIANAMEALKRGAMDFVEKPFDINSVVRLVNLALERKEQTDSPDIKISNDRYLSKHLGFSSTGWKGPNYGQRTIKESLVIYGQGLHSGIKSGLILEPLPKDSGIHFAEIGGSEPAPVFVDFVGSTDFATTVRKGNTSISTIEHLMSALHAYKISNLLIKCNGEIPVIDGSALRFCELIESVGLEEQGGDWYAIQVQEEISFCKPGKVNQDGKLLIEQITVAPSDVLEIEYILDYPKPVGRQVAKFILSDAETYKKEIAPARTFGFIKDIERLQKAGLAAGGRLDNFILIGPEGVVNTQTRFENELSRHKILDLIGDIFLLGRPVLAKITAHMTGHSDNIAIARKIKDFAI